jgi:CelD/BcsL family acetyltransferase involved in cellulose biosynthesis
MPASRPFPAPARSLAGTGMTGPDSVRDLPALLSIGSGASKLVSQGRVFSQMVTKRPQVFVWSRSTRVQAWRTTVCRPSELGSNEVARWHELQDLDVELQHPFLSPEFAQVADRVRSDARVLVVEDGPSIVGFLPFRLGRGRIATPLTPGFNDLQGLVSAAGADLWAPELLASAKLRAWTFDHLLAGYPSVGPSESASTRPTSTWVIDLQGGWAGYVEWADRERRRYFNWMERKQRRLAKEANEYQFCYDTQDPAVLHKLLEIKSNQCRSMGWRDSFAGTWVRAMFDELLALRHTALTGVLSALRVNGEIVAADFSLRSKSIYAGWIIAYDPAWSQLSPGIVRWRHVIEAVADDGIARIDLGRGADDFKRRFSTAQRPLLEGTIAATGTRAKVLVSALELSRQALAPPADSLPARAMRHYRRQRYQMTDGKQFSSGAGAEAR